MAKQIRKIKLHARNRESSEGIKEVPWLNVSGCWLEKLGFKVGDRVEITTREKLLIIQPAEEMQEPAQDYERELKQVKRELKRLL